MGRIDKLLAKLCPQGVIYEMIGNIADVGTGSSNGNEAEEDGKYPFFIRSQTVKTKNDYEYDDEAIIIPGEGGIGDIYHYISGKYALHQRVYRVYFTTDAIMTKFAYYYFHSQFKAYIMKKAVSATVSSIRKPMIESFPIPVPPVDVQREIVRILDSFTLLTAELTAELTARKKQYEFYRNKILTFDTKVTWKRLDEITNLFRGEYITKKSTHEGNVPVILGGQEPAYYIDKSNHEGEIVVVARSGVSAGFVSYWNEPIFVTDGFGYEGKSELIITKYLYYILKNIEGTLNAMKRGAGVPHISGEALAKITLPIPQIAEQKRIVGILEKFDVLCNDISNGLPAEIEARQKQYEYYRDKLLDFKELSE